MAWEEYLGKTVGFAKVMGKMPYSDGSLALEIMNLTLNPEGFLESKFRIMPLIPKEWRVNSPPHAYHHMLQNADEDKAFFHTTAAPLNTVLAMKYFEWDGEAPELLWLSSQGVFRFIPGSRYGEMPGGSGYPSTGEFGDAKGFRELHYFTEKNEKKRVSPNGHRRFPPQMETVGNRVYFTYCDGGQAYVWDGDRLRDFGFYSYPSPPHALGPAAGQDWSNDGGFSDGGRIGTLNHNLTTEDGITTGGIEAGLWYYSVVFENADGSYSATSEPGGRALINHHVAGADSPWTKYGIDFLCRRFWVNGIPKGPPGTVARILLRTMNLRALPNSDDGAPRFLHRIANNTARDYMDDIPDGELGPVWKDRRLTPRGFFFMKFFSGSLFIMRTEQHSSRVWWSEQENINGATPESFFADHWRDVFPETGALTGGLPAIIGEKKVMLLFKERATHYVSGDYPQWSFGTVSTISGCAGPNLAQSAPDGSIVWYGNGTFWKLEEGSVIDIGAAVRQKLKHVNKTRERYGVSWIDPVTKEMVFVLPYKNSSFPNMQFVWDYQNNGWRLRKDLEMRCVERVGDLICVAGKWRGRIDSQTLEPSNDIYIYGRGYPNFPVGGSLTSTYQTGWCSFSDFGPSLHDTHRAAEAVFMFEERSGSHTTLKMYADWNLDSQVGSGISVALSHPENDNIPIYDGTINGGPSIVGSEATMPNVSTSSIIVDPLKYHDRRVYTHRAAIDIPSCNVFSLSVEASTINEPFALISLDVFGPKTSLPGSRSPAIYEGD